VELYIYSPYMSSWREQRQLQFAVYHYNVLKILPLDPILSQLSLYTLSRETLIILCVCILYGLFLWVSCEILTDMIIKFAIFWNASPCRLVEMNTFFCCYISHILPTLKRLPTKFNLYFYPPSPPPLSEHTLKSFGEA
jgi:hypothetical protein